MKRTLLLSLLLISACATSADKKSDVYAGHGKESVSAATLQKYAPPTLDRKLSEKIARMLDMQSPGMGILTPNNDQLFFTWKVSGTHQVWTIKGPQKFPVQMTTGTDPITILQVTPDGKYLLLSIDRDGQENPGIFRQSTSGGEVEKLFQKEKVQARAQGLSPDGRYLIFSANDVKADQYTIYRMNLSDRSIETLFNEPGLWSVGDIDWFNQVLLLEKMTGSTSSEWSTYNLKTKKLDPVVGQGEMQEYSLTFSGNAGEFIALTNKFGDFRKLYRLSPKNMPALPNSAAKGFTAISPDIKSDVEDFSINRRHTRVLYSINDNGFTRARAMDAKSFREIKLPDFTGMEHVNFGATSWDDQFTMVSISSGKAPRLAYSLSWYNGKLTQWTLPSAPEVKLEQFVPAKLEYYPTRDGKKVSMLVRKSPFCTVKPCPVVVHFHGGPEGQSRPGFSPWAQLFVEAGFTFVEPNVRGSDGFGKTWLDSDNGAKRLDVITDIEDASKFIRKNWTENGVAPKVGVMGGSYGGYSTLFAMTYFAGAYDAGVAEVGMSNLLTFLNNTAPYRRALRITEYGDPVKDHDALVKLSPTTYLDRINAPLMIIQGANDPRVPVGEAVQIKSQLDAKKIPAELIIFADEGHGSQKKSNQITGISATIDFFQKHLVNKK